MKLNKKERENEFQKRVGYFLREFRVRHTFHSNLFNGSMIKKSAEIVGVSTDTVYKWEQGYNKPSLYQLKLLCDFYNQDLCELINKVERGYLDE